jgi:hypothetical protein
MKLITCGVGIKKFNFNNYLTDEILNRPSRESLENINYPTKLKLKVICETCVLESTKKPSFKIKMDRR